MVVGVVYLGSIPLTIRAYYRLRRTGEARRAEGVEKAEAVPLPGPSILPLGEAGPASTEWRH